MSVPNKAIVASRGRYYNDRIKSAAADPRRRWAAIRDVLHQTENRTCRSDLECRRLCDGFALFFTDKIHRIKETIKSRLGSTFTDPLQFDSHHDSPMLVDISPPSNDEIRKQILSMSFKSSRLDKIPTAVIKTCVDVFAPLIYRLVTISFTSSEVQSSHRHAITEERGFGCRYFR